MTNAAEIRRLLDQVAAGELTVDRALKALRTFPFEQLDCATLDHHRQLRDGFGEVVYCESKTADQVRQIMERLAAASPRVLGTRATYEQYEAAHNVVSELQYDESARAIWLDRHPPSSRLKGVVVVAAGTSDLGVTDESVLTLKLMGHHAKRIVDVGIAGLHRLLHHLETLQSANVIIAVAGMEGALPSLVAGLVDAPVIGVPTSVGYGASFGGVAPLLAMLNSCASGVSVVNIDNGFGAAYIAAMINKRIEGKRYDERPADQETR